MIKPGVVFGSFQQTDSSFQQTSVIKIEPLPGPVHPQQKVLFEVLSKTEIRQNF